MTKSEGYGHGDSAFYVGASPPQNNPKTTRLDHLESYENVLGFSGTNARYLVIEKSNFYNNGVGVVPNTLDSEPFEPAADSVIRNNNIFWNNFNYFLPNSRVKTVSERPRRARRGRRSSTRPGWASSCSAPTAG